MRGSRVRQLRNDKCPTDKPYRTYDDEWRTKQYLVGIYPDKEGVMQPTYNNVSALYKRTLFEDCVKKVLKDEKRAYKRK